MGGENNHFEPKQYLNDAEIQQMIDDDFRIDDSWESVSKWL